MITLPSTMSRLVDKLGRIVAPWNSYFQQFTQAPAPTVTVTVGASPFFYTAREPGTIYIHGGTITILQIIRGQTVINITGTNAIPMCINDVLQVIYTVLPTLTFFPSYGIAPQ